MISALFQFIKLIKQKYLLYVFPLSSSSSFLNSLILWDEIHSIVWKKQKKIRQKKIDRKLNFLYCFAKVFLELLWSVFYFLCLHPNHYASFNLWFIVEDEEAVNVKFLLSQRPEFCCNKHIHTHTQTHTNKKHQKLNEITFVQIIWHGKIKRFVFFSVVTLFFILSTRKSFTIPLQSNFKNFMIDFFCVFVRSAKVEEVKMLLKNENTEIWFVIFPRNNFICWCLCVRNRKQISHCSNGNGRSIKFHILWKRFTLHIAFKMVFDYDYEEILRFFSYFISLWLSYWQTWMIF